MSKKVMVVDDSRFVFEELRFQLRDTEFNVCVYCRDGEQAVTDYEAEQPDLVTMDIILPGMDGLDTLKELLEKWPDARVLVISSLAFEETMKEARTSGAKGFISKPFHKEDVVAAFLEALK